MHTFKPMRNTLFLLLTMVPILAIGQTQINPQAGITFQSLTDSPEGTEFKANIGFIVGGDIRFGDVFYLQPGAFYGRNVTATTFQATDPDGNVIAEVEDDLIRTTLKLRGMLGYKLINGDGFKLRVATGVSYDLLLGIDNSEGNIAWEMDDFKDGSFNLDLAVGLDIAFLTVEPGLSYGLTNVFEDDPLLSENDAKYVTTSLTVGIVLGGGSR